MKKSHCQVSVGLKSLDVSPCNELLLLPLTIKNYLAWEYFFTHKSTFGVHYRTGSTGSPGRWIPGSLGRWVTKCDQVPSLANWAQWVLHRQQGPERMMLMSMSMWSLRWHFTNKSVAGAPYSFKSYSQSHSWTQWCRERWLKQCRLEVAEKTRTNVVKTERNSERHFDRLCPNFYAKFCLTMTASLLWFEVWVEFNAPPDTV